MMDAAPATRATAGVWAHSGDTNPRGAQESHWKMHHRCISKHRAQLAQTTYYSLIFEKRMIFKELKHTHTLQSGSPFLRFLSWASQELLLHFPRDFSFQMTFKLSDVHCRKGNGTYHSPSILLPYLYLPSS